MPHEQCDYFSPVNQSNHWSRYGALSLLLPWSFVKLPIVTTQLLIVALLFHLITYNCILHMLGVRHYILKLMSTSGIFWKFRKFQPHCMQRIIIHGARRYGISLRVFEATMYCFLYYIKTLLTRRSRLYYILKKRRVAFHSWDKWRVSSWLAVSNSDENYRKVLPVFFLGVEIGTKFQFKW